jgi:hypothetical protein
VFARFPLPDENFLKSGSDARYADVDWNKLGKKDQKEIQKLFSIFIGDYLNDAVGGITQFSRVDTPAFLRECVDCFENLFAEKDGAQTEVKTVDQFLALPEAAVYEIAKDLYAYAREKEDFTLGE